MSKDKLLKAVNDAIAALNKVDPKTRLPGVLLDKAGPAAAAAPADGGNKPPKASGPKMPSAPKIPSMHPPKAPPMLKAKIDEKAKPVLGGLGLDEEAVSNFINKVRAKRALAEPTGVHRPHESEGDTGHYHKDTVAWNKEKGLNPPQSEHKHVMREMKNIKPNLPKSEDMAKKQADWMKSCLAKCVKMEKSEGGEEKKKWVCKSEDMEKADVRHQSYHDSKEKLTTGKENKPSHEKGVHPPAANRLNDRDFKGASPAGMAVRDRKVQEKRKEKFGSWSSPDPSHIDRAKEGHKEKLKELKSMPKPNLPKSEDMAKDDMPHPAGSPEERSHAVAEGQESLPNALADVKGSDAKKKFFDHLKSLSSKSQHRSPENIKKMGGTDTAPMDKADTIVPDSGYGKITIKG